MKGKKFVAMDFSKEMIDMARRKLIYRDDADFAVADGKEMPFRDRKFDAVLLVAVLHSMYGSEHTAILKELNRVMKPGAELLVTVWNKRQPRFFLKGRESFIEWKLGERVMQRYYYLFTKKEMKQLLEKNGFQVISIVGSTKKSFGFSSDIIAIARKRC